MPEMQPVAGNASQVWRKNVMLQITIMTCEKNRSQHGYTVIYEELTEGGYQVIVPALPGVITYGRTLEETRKMASDAILCHIQGLIKDGEEIPEDPFNQQMPITEQIKITV